MYLELIEKIDWQAFASGACFPKNSILFVLPFLWALYVLIPQIQTLLLYHPPRLPVTHSVICIVEQIKAVRAQKLTSRYSIQGQLYLSTIVVVLLPFPLWVVARCAIELLDIKRW